MRFDNPITDHGFIFPDIANFPDVKMRKGDINEDEYLLRKLELNQFDARSSIGIFAPGSGFKTYRIVDGNGQTVGDSAITSETNATNNIIWYGKNDELRERLSTNGMLYRSQVSGDGIMQAPDVVQFEDIPTVNLPGIGERRLTGKAIGAMITPTAPPSELGYPADYAPMDLGDVPSEARPPSTFGPGFADSYDIKIGYGGGLAPKIKTNNWIFSFIKKAWYVKPELKEAGWRWNDESESWYNINQPPGQGLIIPAILTINGNLYFSEAHGWMWTGLEWKSCLELCKVTPFLALTSNDTYESYDRRSTVYAPAVNDYLITAFYETGEQYYPSNDVLDNEKTKSLDGKFHWGGVIGWQFQGQAEISSDGKSATQLQWTDIASLNVDGTVDTRFNKYIECFELNEWEDAFVDFVIPDDDTFGLYTNTSLYVVGSRGGFGELWVDKVRIDILLTSNERVKVDQTAKLSTLALTIEDVLSNTELLVAEEYDQAANVQGGIQSNFAVNRYATFGSGFQIGFLESEEQVNKVMARYEGKILDVDGHTLIMDKSYQEYGGSIGAVSGSEDSPNIASGFDEFFVRYRIKDPDNLYTKIVFTPERESLVINFKPVNMTNYPGSIAYKLLDPLPDDIVEFDTAYIVQEVTPDLDETVDLIPFIDEKIPDTVLKAPKIDVTEPVIRKRATAYKNHTDLVGVESGVRKELEDKIFSGSLLDVSINVDYNHFENFSHFGSVEKRIRNFKSKLESIELFTAKSQSLGGTSSTPYITGQTSGSIVSGSSDQQAHWDMEKRKVINEFDDFENYMYFQSSSYLSSSNGIDYNNAAPKASGDGTLTSPYVLYSVSSSNFTTWFDGQVASASNYDNLNTNRLVSLLPSHVSYDTENAPFITFMDMMGHHYDIIWTHIKSMTDSHDRSEDITKGISAELVKPVAESLGFKMQEGKDLVSLPEYQLGLQESGSNTGVYNVRFSKKSQQDISREIWNRLLSSMPYLLKTKGTKQGLKALIAAYGIPTSILRIQEYGGPKIRGGAPEFEIKQKYTYAVHLKGAQRIQSPWYRNEETQRVNDTIEFRFKTDQKEDVLLATKHKTTNHIESAIYVKQAGEKGKLSFALTGSEGLVTASLEPLSMYNGEYWSVMVRRRKGESGFTSSYDGMVMTSETSSVTQSFDIFAGFYDSGTDEIITKASALPLSAFASFLNLARTVPVAAVLSL